ncbi:MAG TPA: glycosyltransferase family 39 protein [Thermoanaerobaculia bacterium]
MHPDKTSERGLRTAVLIFLCAKVLVLWFGVQAALIMTNTSLPANWLHIWNQWDSLHYVSIAENGYQSTGEARSSIVFYPLFPWLTRIVKFVARDTVTAGVIVATLASFAAAFLLYRLAQHDDEHRPRAIDTVLFLSIFPTSYFLHIAYTESLFLALTLASFLFARRERWALAGVAGAFAALTRVNGVLLIPALMVEAWLQWRRTRKFDPRWLWIFFVASGLGVYLAVNKKVAGSWFAFRIYMREVFDRKGLDFPWVSIYDAWLSVWERAPYDAIMVGWQELLFTLIAIAVCVWSWLRLRASYATWATLNVLLFTSTGFLLGAPRYCLTLFPVYFCFAQVTEGRPVLRSVIVLWSVLWLGMFEALFVGGKWAF